MDGRKNFFKIIMSFFVVAFFVPQQISKYHFISDFVLDLKFSKSSPPLAVIEDESLPYVSPEAVVVPSTTVLLQTQKGSEKNISRLLEIAMTHKQTLRGGLNKTNLTPRQLSGLVLDKKSPNIAQLKKFLGHYEESENTFSDTNTRLVLDENLKKVSHEIAFQNQTQKKERREFDLTELEGQLNWQQRARLDAAEGIEQDLYEIDETGSFQSYALGIIEKESQQEVSKNGFYNNFSEKNIHEQNTPKKTAEKSETGKNEAIADKALFSFPGWLVGLPVNPEPRPAVRLANREITSRAAVRKTQQASPKNENAPQSQDSKEDGGSQTLAAASFYRSKNETLYNKPISQAFISGNLEMSGGLALTGDEKVVVYHRLGGEVMSYGNVILEKGRYEIFIEAPQTGLLVAEVLREDRALGRAEVLLPELLMKTHNTGALKEVSLLLKPTQEKVMIQASSAYQPSRWIEADTAVLNNSLPLKKKAKTFVAQLQNSSLISKITKQGHWGGLKMGSSFQEIQHTLFSEGAIQALFNLIRVPYSKKQGTIVGKIKIKGKEVAAATVESLTEDLGNPIYFNSFLPDEKLQETSVAGMFSYVGVEPGTYVLRAKHKGKYLMSQIVTVESGFVTEVDFDIQEPSLSEVFVFDIQNSQPIPAEIGFLGADKVAQTRTGRQLLSLAGTQGVQILQAQSLEDGFYKVRTTLNKSQKEILLPMIHEEWLSKVLSRERYNVVPEAGVILGLAQEAAFSVEMDPQGYNEETQVFYFDKNGRVLEGAISAPEGGGVVVVNANPGLRGLLLKNSDGLVGRIVTVAVDSSAINVFTASH